MEAGLEVLTRATPPSMVLQRVLGRGAYGVVYMGTWRGILSAIKKVDFLRPTSEKKMCRTPHAFIFVPPQVIIRVIRRALRRVIRRVIRRV
jgi:hypothetical protein